MISSRFVSDLIQLVRVSPDTERLRASILVLTPGDVNLVLTLNYQVRQNPIPKILGILCLYENRGVLPVHLIHDNVKQMVIQIFDDQRLVCQMEIDKTPFHPSILTIVGSDGLLHRESRREYGREYVTLLKETEAKPLLILLPPEIYAYQATRLVCQVKLFYPEFLIRVDPLEEPIGV